MTVTIKIITFGLLAVILAGCHSRSSGPSTPGTISANNATLILNSGHLTNIATSHYWVNIQLSADSYCRMAPRSIASFKTGYTNTSVNQFTILLEKGQLLFYIHRKASAEFNLKVVRGVLGVPAGDTNDLIISLTDRELTVGIGSPSVFFVPIYLTEGLRDPLVVSGGHAINFDSLDIMKGNSSTLVDLKKWRSFLLGELKKQ